MTSARSGFPSRSFERAADLTEKEREAVRQHTIIGETILSPLLEKDIIAMVRSHHEQIDGQGYPDALSGDEIPLGGRIIAVADAYDAMTSPRPYRSQIPLANVWSFPKGRGKQWDIDATGVLLRIADDGLLPPRSAEDSGEEVTESFRATEWELDAL
jgi:HD-GYP domain-containing protein (c-di-GMP phosphodiesterase class II)